MESQAPPGPAGWAVTAEPLLSIGQAEGDADYQFDQVLSAIRLSDGRIVVADNAAPSPVRYYASDGAFLKGVGRRGPGPEEYQRVGNLQRLAGDSVVALNVGDRKAVLLDPAGEPVAMTSFRQATGPAPVAVLRLGDGRWVGYLNGFDVASMQPVGLQRMQATVLLLNESGAVTDTLGVFPGPDVAFVDRRTGIVPFGHNFALAISKDGLYIGTGDDVAFNVRDPGGQLFRSVRAPGIDLRLTDEDLGRFRESTLASLPNDEARTQIASYLEWRSPPRDEGGVHANAAGSGRRRLAGSVRDAVRRVRPMASLRPRGSIHRRDQRARATPRSQCRLRLDPRRVAGRSRRRNRSSVRARPAGPAQPADMIQRVRNVVASGAAGIALDADRLTIEPVLNRGGFVNHSFRLSDGRATYRLKLASEPDAITELERWRRFEALLASRYRAPRMVGWLRLDGAEAGPLFEWINGVTPEQLEDVPAEPIARLLADLHSDADLRDSLARLGDPISSCANAYRATYHRRYMADLEFIAASPPPFLQPETLVWMREEAMRLESRIAGAPSFAETADSPVHGDLWLDNLLIDRTGELWVLDWDGLSLGDPVLDWAILSGPSRGRIDGASDAAPTVMPQTPATHERFALHARAALLDWIIDPLADWVQAAHEPFFGELVRSANEQVHYRALSAYRRRYG